MGNQLWFGDNLTVLREHVATASVDLVYLDPPFNSKANYNVLFRTPRDEAASAQVEAFQDTWTWGDEAQSGFDEIMRAGGAVASIIRALHSALNESDMMAYLVMMALRLEELQRVLKPTGAIYLHCDPTASHYLKIILDSVFSARRFGGEIIWKRTSAHSDAGQGRRRLGYQHDTILQYMKTDKYTWNQSYHTYSDDYTGQTYRHIEPGTGRRYGSFDITAPGGSDPKKRNPHYEFMGVLRYWRFSKERMQELYAQGRIIQSRPGAVPRQKRYLDEMPGVPLQTLWTDIPPIASRAAERLGYPTQKPQALLERIVQLSSNPGGRRLGPVLRMRHHCCGGDRTRPPVDRDRCRISCDPRD